MTFETYTGKYNGMDGAYKEILPGLPTILRIMHRRYCCMNEFYKEIKCYKEYSTLTRKQLKEQLEIMWP